MSEPIPNVVGDIVLDGCPPRPLMSYLKALGILRLVSAHPEHGDSKARAAWRDDRFVLRSRFDADELTSFFLEKYAPTPVLAPWNGGSGFYVKWDDERGRFRAREAANALDRLARSTAVRFASYRRTIESTKDTLSEMALSVDLERELEGLDKKARKRKLDGMLLFEHDGKTWSIEKADKDALLTVLRARVLSDESLAWLDAAFVLLTGYKKNRTEAPVLGSGGNVGNADFSVMFFQALLRVLPAELPSKDAPGDEKLSERSRELLRASLFGVPLAGIPKQTVGQFDPARAGGPNTSQGFDGAPHLNPWDFVLMIEGALTLRGNAARRLGARAAHGAFPFSVDASPVGYASAGKDSTRGEQWLPLRSRFATARELAYLFAEGRASVGARPARDGVDFARAAASLGVDRGIDAFVRFELQERLGQSYLATSLGRFPVRPRAGVELLREIDPWLDRFRRAASGDKAPPRFRIALRRIEAADRESLGILESLSGDRFFRYIAGESDERNVCGVSAIAAMMEVLDGTAGELLCYEQSVEEESGSVVTYASMAFFG